MDFGEWRTCGDPGAMVPFLGQMSTRRRCLFAVACCRHFEPLMTEARCQKLLDVRGRFPPVFYGDIEPNVLLESVEVAEGFADGEFDADRKMLLTNATHALAHVANSYYGELCDYDDIDWDTLTTGEVAGLVNLALYQHRGYEVVANVSRAFIFSREDLPSRFPTDDLTDDERGFLCDLIREVFPYHLFPWAELSVARAWKTPAVLGLADEMYAERKFEHMPILADALEDSGCTNRTILRHCRSDKAHYRGCWVIDTILGKS